MNSYASPTPVIEEGRVYVHFGSYLTACLDTKTFETIWERRDLECDHHRGPASSPILFDGKLFVAYDGFDVQYVVAFDKVTGRTVWRRDRDIEYGTDNGDLKKAYGTASVIHVDEQPLVIYPSAIATIAYDPATGATVWKTAVPDLGNRGKDGAGYSSVVVTEAAGVKQYVQLVGRALIGVRASDGKFLWSYNRINNGTANVPTPVVSDDLVMTSSGYGDGGTGAVRLSKDGEGVKAEQVYYLDRQTFQNHHGGMILVGDHVYSGAKHNNGFPICVELANKMLSGEKSDLLQGFVSNRTKRKFDAFLRYDYGEGRPTFEFPPRKKAAKKKSTAEKK